MVRATRRQGVDINDPWNSSPAHCEVAKTSIYAESSQHIVHRILITRSHTVIKFILVAQFGQLFEIDLVSQDGTDAAEALHELIAFARPVRNKF